MAKPKESVCNKIKIRFSVGKAAYELNCNFRNYILSKITEVEGKETGTALKYYTRPEEALNQIIDMKVKDTPVTTFEDLLEAIARSKREVLNMYSMEIDADDIESEVA